ncbi:MAG: hypothetical protein J6M06_00460 [Synergistaceae bacterium]|nr:hypothetical protein [Synergistaceae bacterium]
MSFAYGSMNRFHDQIFQKAVSATGDYGPVIAGGDTNGALAIVVTAATDTVVSGLKLSYKESDTEAGTYAAPADANVLTFGGTSYAAGDVLGMMILPNGCKDFVKATLSGTLTSGTLDLQLQYLAR